MDLNEDVKYIKGVGPNRVKLLNKIGIFTLKDLITYYPRGYEDRSKPKNICECVNALLKGQDVQVKTPSKSTKTNEEIAVEVIRGLWGVYPERKKLLEEAGYNYSEVQKIVNQLMNGKYNVYYD